MKSILLGIYLIISVFVIPETKQDFVEIRFIGIQQKPSKQSFFVTERLQMSTMKNTLNDLGFDLSTINNEQMLVIWKSSYSTVGISKTTYSAISKFVKSQNKYISNKHIKNDVSDYCIIVNGEKFYIVKKFQTSFFNSFVRYLKNKGGQQSVIIDIESYLN